MFFVYPDSSKIQFHWVASSKTKTKEEEIEEERKEVLCKKSRISYII